MTFKDNLRTYRLKNGLTAKALAESLGISYSTYMGYENEGKEPKYDLLCRIAGTLGCAPNDLLGFQPAIDDSFQYYADLVESLDLCAFLEVKALPDGQVAIESSSPTLKCTFPSKESFVLYIKNAIEYMTETTKYKVVLNNTIADALESRHDLASKAADTISHSIEVLQRALSEATTPEERGKLKQALKKALSELESSE